MKTRHFLSSIPWLEIIVLLAIGSVLVVNLLFTPAIGMADNGDFGRMMAKVGLEHASDRVEDRYFNYFERMYKIVPATTPLLGDFLSSEAFFHQAAFWIGHPFAQNGLWDIRFLGGLHIFALLLAVGCILAASRGLRFIQRLLVAVFLILFLTDLRVMSYLNSFYSEPAFLIFLGFWLAATIFWIRKPGCNWPAMILFYLLSGLLLTVKTQNTLMGILFAAGGLGIGCLKKDRKQMKVAIALSAALIILTTAYFQLTPQRYKRANQFNIVFHDILPTSNTMDTLAFFNLPQDLAAYSGRDYYMEGGLVHDPEFDRIFFQQTSFSDVIRYYYSHPAWVFQQLNRGASQVFRMRLDFLGNYERASGLPPLSHVEKFTFWSDFKERFLPKTSLFLISLYSAPVIAGLQFWFRRPTARPYVVVFTILVGISVLQFGMTMLVGGMRDPAKQLWQFNLIWDVIFGFGVVGLLGLLFRKVTTDPNG
ncbi:MAG TPA: hypothetical protein VN452_06415 [Longilinea sp.]|nr:hypothetical protein [Longilinea sp.]